MSDLIEQYCEGYCADSGSPGKFKDCTGCEIAEAVREQQKRIDELTNRLKRLGGEDMLNDERYLSAEAFFEAELSARIKYAQESIK